MLKTKTERKTSDQHPPLLFWWTCFFAKWLESLAAVLPNSRIWRPPGLGCCRPVAPHLVTLETPYPACRQRPPYANTMSAECPHQQVALGQRSEQGHAGVHQMMFRRCVSASVVVMGQRAAGRSMRRVEVDQNRILVPCLNMAPRTINSWLPRPPYPPPGPQQLMLKVVGTPQAASGRVRMTFAATGQFSLLA
jgi:hypothetical protein